MRNGDLVSVTDYCTSSTLLGRNKGTLSFHGVLRYESTMFIGFKLLTIVRLNIIEKARIPVAEICRLRSEGYNHKLSLCH